MEIKEMKNNSERKNIMESKKRNESMEIKKN